MGLSIWSHTMSGSYCITLTTFLVQRVLPPSPPEHMAGTLVTFVWLRSPTPVNTGEGAAPPRWLRGGGGRQEPGFPRTRQGSRTPGLFLKGSHGTEGWVGDTGQGETSLTFMFMKVSLG